MLEGLRDILGGEARTLFVPGEPFPAPRPHVIGMGAPCRTCKKRPLTRVINGEGASARKYEDWRRAIKNHAIVSDMELAARPTPVAMLLVFQITPPRTMLRANGEIIGGERRRTVPTGASDGDTDNLAKAVLDSLDGILFDNDSQVAPLIVDKVWALGDHTPGVTITYLPLPETKQ